MFAFTEEQSKNFADFLEQNGLTEQDVFEVMERQKRKADEADHVARLAEKKAKYVGNHYKLVGADVTIYYKVIAAHGDRGVSCIWFGMNPFLDRYDSYHGYISEVVVSDDTEFMSGCVPMDQLDRCQKIDEAEFEQAFTDWARAVMQLEWDE